MQTVDLFIQESNKSSDVKYTTINFYENRVDELETQLEETKSDLSHISTLFIEEKEQLQKMTKCFHMCLRENENLKKRIQELKKKTLE
jgi:chromosome segregation ATPase